jgi:membrane protease YdiL (CAAX protease family)
MAPDGRLPRLAAVALLAAPALFVANYAANHAWQPPMGRLAYTLTVVLLIGTVLPCAALLALARRGVTDLRRWGYSFRLSDLAKITVALALAGVIAAFQVGDAVLADPTHAARLFVWLIGASLAEVLVFCGIVHNVAAAMLEHRLPRWSATLLAAVIASLAFGFYHFSHAPPWNTLSTAWTLTVVWLAVSAIFVCTRSLWAAAAFNTVMATTGFIINRVTRLDDQSIAVGLLFATLSIAIVVAALLVKLSVRR